ncbi:hypothetical protein HAX54_018606 [Datura stramonium]|uniref:WAT1-related protein n=1 Tax=Datura stramonium TaxID=4076 RepID=A0ABS8UNU4_DATST|nr:hypothetical protein [Datura stramonium]
MLTIYFAGMALFSKAAISKGMNPYVFVTYRQAFAVIALAPPLPSSRVKGPQLNFMNWSKGKTKGNHSSNLNYSLKEEWLKGSLVMLLANIIWSVWLILQVRIVKQYPAKLRLATLYCCLAGYNLSLGP